MLKLTALLILCVWVTPFSVSCQSSGDFVGEGQYNYEAHSACSYNESYLSMLKFVYIPLTAQFWKRLENMGIQPSVFGTGIFPKNQDMQVYPRDPSDIFPGLPRSNEPDSSISYPFLHYHFPYNAEEVCEMIQDFDFVLGGAYVTTGTLVVRADKLHNSLEDLVSRSSLVACDSYPLFGSGLSLARPVDRLSPWARFWNWVLKEVICDTSAEDAEMLRNDPLPSSPNLALRENF
ncbi:MAG: hypothetical protein LBJ89_04000 [Holosporales bacterium]|jgi:hypothetical protein|nr:hypothetical protein [Holosporales bacterium]